MTVTSNAPAENTDPWYAGRSTFDAELKATANGAETAAAAAQAKADAAVPTSGVAGLNTVGWARAVFIPKGGTIPGGTPVYTLVVEAAT